MNRDSTFLSYMHSQTVTLCRNLTALLSVLNVFIVTSSDNYSTKTSDNYSTIQGLNSLFNQNRVGNNLRSLRLFYVLLLYVKNKIKMGVFTRCSYWTYVGQYSS